MEKDFEKLTLKHKKRKLRIQRSGREKLQQNLKANKGMRLLREEGRLRKYSDRCNQNSSETIDWRKFMKQSKKHNDIVNLRDPDLVQRLNEETRKEKEILKQNAEKAKEVKEEAERIRKIQREEAGGEWIYYPEYSEYQWEGEGEPVDDDPEYVPLSEKELADLKLQEEKMLAAMIEEKKHEAREKRRQRNKDQKAAMNKPIDPLPVTGLCEYEKLRKSNIKEREEAMVAAGFFDLNRKIGLLTLNCSKFTNV